MKERLTPDARSLGILLLRIIVRKTSYLHYSKPFPFRHCPLSALEWLPRQPSTFDCNHQTLTRSWWIQRSKEANRTQTTLYQGSLINYDLWKTFFRLATDQELDSLWLDSISLKSYTKSILRRNMKGIRNPGWEISSSLVCKSYFRVSYHIRFRWVEVEGY